MAKTPEGRIVHATMSALRKHGGFWVKIHGGPTQRAGLPDIIGCYRGRFVSFEVKTPETAHDASPVQRITMRRIMQAGGVSRIVVSAQEALEVCLAIDSKLDE